MTSYEPEVTVVSDKGQVVIPQSIREKLGLRPKTRLLVYGYGDVVILKKMKIKDVIKDLKALYSKVDRRIAKYGELSDKEIEEMVHKYRSKKIG
jgi:AbrB family looped-hinge helix DNA binding protein